MKSSLGLSIFVLGTMSLGLAGCQQDTNVITEETVRKANEDRIRKIDNDPTIDPAGREKMKAMMGLTKDGQGGRRGPPSGN